MDHVCNAAANLAAWAEAVTIEPPRSRAGKQAARSLMPLEGKALAVAQRWWNRP